MTNSVKTQIGNKRQKINTLRKKHEDLFKKECLNEPAKFIPKFPYSPKQSTEKIIALFFGEIIGGQDIYTEFVDTEYKPLDSERTLYKWLYNTEFETEYEKSEPDASGYSRYFIPVNELLRVLDLHEKPKEQEAPKERNIQLRLKIEDKPDVNPEKKTEAKTDEIQIALSELEDSPLSEMTMRDKLAIDWLEPISKKEWLNKVILEKKNYGR